MHASQSALPQGSFFPQACPSPPQATATSGVVKWLIIGGITLAVGAVAIVVVFVYVGAAGPDTKVLPGRQVPARFMAQICKLDLIEPEEELLYFYSDALLDIEDGFYLLTDRKVVIYSRHFDEPAMLIPFSEIDDIEVAFSNSWLEDSIITLTLADGTWAWFPVSREGGGDRKVYKALKKKWNARVQQGP